MADGHHCEKKTVKSQLYLSNRLTDFDQIWHDDADWPHTLDGALKFPIFFKNQDGGSRHVEKSQSRVITAMDWPIFAKFGTIMKNGSLNVQTVKKNRIFKIQDGGRPPFWKPINRHISATVWPIWHDDMMMQIGHVQGKTVKISNFWKSKTAAAAVLKNNKNHDISATVWPIFLKSGTIIQNGSLNRPDRLRIWISQIQYGGRPPFKKIVKSPYLKNRLTDFDEI